MNEKRYTQIANAKDSVDLLSDVILKPAAQTPLPKEKTPPRRRNFVRCSNEQRRKILDPANVNATQTDVSRRSDRGRGRPREHSAKMPIGTATHGWSPRMGGRGMDAAGVQAERSEPTAKSTREARPARKRPNEAETVTHQTTFHCR